MKKLLLILMLLVLPCQQIFGEWDVNIPLATDVLTDYPVDTQANLDALELVLREYPKGLTLSYSSATTIVVSTGGVVCADSGGTTKKFRGNTSTTNVTFSDLDTGAEASGTTYYIFANCDAVATTATFKISASSSSPSGVTYYKKLGSFYNDSSSNIQASSITNDSVAIGSLFGDYASKSFGTTYQALTDGIVVGYTNYVTTTHGFEAISDSSASPSTTVQYGYGPWVSGASGLSWPICFPVKKGNYYVVNNLSSSGGTLRFIPIGS